MNIFYHFRKCSNDLYDKQNIIAEKDKIIAEKENMIGSYSRMVKRLEDQCERWEQDREKKNRFITELYLEITELRALLRKARYDIVEQKSIIARIKVKRLKNGRRNATTNGQRDQSSAEGN